MADFNTNPTSTVPELTSIIAQEIFALIKTHGDADKAYKNKGNSDYEPQHFEKVDKEIDRLFKRINLICSGNLIETEEQSHYDEETGEKIIDQEAVYYQPEGKNDVKTKFQSDYLDDTDVLRAFVENKGFDYDTEFDQFLSSYEGS